MKRLLGFASVLLFFGATSGRAEEVDVAIVCPEKVTANVNWNDKIGSDPTFHFESGTETLTFNFGHMRQQGQLITCSYKRWALLYKYEVKRTIKSCAQVSPRILECKVVQ